MTETDKMLSENVIEAALAEWVVPIVIFSRKDGTLQFCVDYCELNAVTK